MVGGSARGAISDGRGFLRRTNGCKGRAKALPAEGTVSATLSGIARTQTSPLGAASGLAYALMQRMDMRSNSKPWVCQGVLGQLCAHSTQGSIPLHARDTRAPRMGALAHAGTQVSHASPAASVPQSVWDSHTFGRAFLKTFSVKPRFQNSGWGVSMWPAAVTMK